LGGSGSNPVGYSCWGSFTLDGRTYRDGIPGTSLLAPGRHLRVLTVPGDPALVDTPQALANEHPTATVYLLPAVLLAVLAFIVLVRRGGRRQPALRSPLDLGGRGARLEEAVGGV
jgi:hypothetical protein